MLSCFHGGVDFALFCSNNSIFYMLSKICQATLQKNFFSILNISFFTAFFSIKCCLFRLITALSRFFYFFLLTQPCFYLLSKICQATLQKNFFSILNISFFTAFFSIKCCLFRLITALSRFFYFFLLTQPCFYLLSKNLSGCFAKNFFFFVNFSFFRRFSQRTVARFR